jgi:hypothetical protein
MKPPACAASLASLGRWVTPNSKSARVAWTTSTEAF